MIRFLIGCRRTVWMALSIAYYQPHKPFYYWWFSRASWRSAWAIRFCDCWESPDGCQCGG